jgi:hypothetical protein
MGRDCSVCVCGVHTRVYACLSPAGVLRLLQTHGPGAVVGPGAHGRHCRHRLHRQQLRCKPPIKTPNPRFCSRAVCCLEHCGPHNVCVCVCAHAPCWSDAAHTYGPRHQCAPALPSCAPLSHTRTHTHTHLPPTPPPTHTQQFLNIAPAYKRPMFADPDVHCF